MQGFRANEAGKPMKIEFRSANLADVAKITGCVKAAYQHYVARMGKKPGPMLDDYAALIRDHHVFVATSSGDVLLAGLLVLIEQPDTILLDNVAVHPDFQGHGLGKRLMQKAEQEAKRLGYQSLILYTHELMTENQAIYKKIGYVETHRIEEKGFKRVYMRKNIV